MKTGKSLVDMANELTRIHETAKDFIVPVSKMQAVPLESGVGLEFQNGELHNYGLNNWSTTQGAAFTDIPSAYLNRISQENPALAANALNHGFSMQKDERRMIRTVDGKVRGFLSPKYRRLDGYDLLGAVFPTLQENGLTVAASELTERRLYLKALSPKLLLEVKKGDMVQYGITISTSDVGAGAFRVEPFVYRLDCLNGMISATTLRKYHRGKDVGESDDAQELYSDRTKELSDAAFWCQVNDIVKGSLDPAFFEREVDKLRIAAEMPIKNYDLESVVELTAKAVNLPLGKSRLQNIVAALANGNEGAGLTQYGLINSFTRAAYDDSESFDDSIEMERAAGKILTLAMGQWKRIAEAEAA
jgi:hypothetical protein